MLEVYAYSIQIFILALIGFLFGLLLKEQFEVNIYSAVSIMTIFSGLFIFLLQILLNFYLGMDIQIVNNFPDYLAKQFGGFVLSLMFGAIYKKNF
jgi:hypothetical protein